MTPQSIQNTLNVRFKNKFTKENFDSNELPPHNKMVDYLEPKIYYNSDEPCFFLSLKSLRRSRENDSSSDDSDGDPPRIGCVTHKFKRKNMTKGSPHELIPGYMCVE
ncbi:Hypothetical predicted protein [Mytilus galloprovincialis]|uniref:Uncharacterized protein n=1 Tax=Mytilus galloprovincialis TaxID=29158 RepID=A0A8B6EU14_MYTGA|nr:Hypothetical predicted protein [Mytilus galloprovincialis]